MTEPRTDRRSPRRRHTPGALVSRIVVAGASATGMFGLVAAMGAAARVERPVLQPVAQVSVTTAPPAGGLGTVAPAITPQPQTPVVTSAPAPPMPAATAAPKAKPAGRTKRS